MPSTANQLLTVGRIALRLNEPIHRIEYVLRTRSIRPCGIAGNCRIYAEEDLDRIAAELQKIDSQRERMEKSRG